MNWEIAWCVFLGLSSALFVIIGCGAVASSAAEWVERKLGMPEVVTIHLGALAGIFIVVSVIAGALA